ncbi:hypothetical protein T03_14123 [Trichinella britovi]|uniref:Uncharacterized protein n=1 Tax=Trichinella britovi TaxID=45882 RepID=A0A0V1CXT4_TRIBR|nr:hypothetical protein T03_14123 [Trichinella britovi]
MTNTQHGAFAHQQHQPVSVIVLFVNQHKAQMGSRKFHSQFESIVQNRNAKQSTTITRLLLLTRKKSSRKEIITSSLFQCILHCACQAEQLLDRSYGWQPILMAPCHFCSTDAEILNKAHYILQSAPS